MFLKLGGMTGILGQLKWESLKKRRKDSRLILLFTIFALSAGFLLTKINIGKTGNQQPPSGGFWLPVFPILIFCKLGTSGKCKNGEYKGLKGKARIPTDDLIPKNRRCRNQHFLAFQTPSASKEAYNSSFFPQTIRDWNDLPDSLTITAEMSDDCVSKFASLVRAKD